MVAGLREIAEVHQVTGQLCGALMCPNMAQWKAVSQLVRQAEMDAPCYLWSISSVDLIQSGWSVWAQTGRQRAHSSLSPPIEACWQPSSATGNKSASCVPVCCVTGLNNENKQVLDLWAASIYSLPKNQIRNERFCFQWINIYVPYDIVFHLMALFKSHYIVSIN